MPQAAHRRVRDDAMAAVRAGIAACAPGPLLESAWARVFGEGGYDGPAPLVVAAGKASVGLADAAARLLSRSACGGVNAGIVARPPEAAVPSALFGARWRVMEVDHPLPSQRNLIAARTVADAAKMAGVRGTPVIALISGGASAHLTLPAVGLSLAEIRGMTDRLLRAGASIGELNAVRGACEQLKAGGLARLAAPSRVWAFVLSDVVNDRVEVIGSGPTADGGGVALEAVSVIDRRLAEEQHEAVARVRAHLMRAGRGTPVTNAVNTVIGGNATAVEAAAAKLRELGYRVASRIGVEGEARDVGREFGRELLGGVGEAEGPIAIVWGGETTVAVRGTGFGGRNQEAALGAAEVLAGRAGACAAMIATDGVDGTTPPGGTVHAGAIVDGETMEAARTRGVDIARALEAHDSHGACGRIGCAVALGATGTNVSDLWVGICSEKA